MGGILTGTFKTATGIAGLFGGSPGRAAADDEYRSKVAASELGELEAKQLGDYEAGQLRMLGSQMISKQRTAYANSGIDATSGTAASVMADTRLMTERDARQAENNAARRVRGYREQKRQAESEYRRRIDEETYKSVGSIMGGIGDFTGSLGGGGF
jgi:hypothetical protein